MKILSVLFLLWTAVFDNCETKPVWTLFPGKLKQVDISSADVLWGVNSGDNIFLLDGNAWKHVGGLLKHVSVGDSGVWGVNKHDYIFYRLGLSLVKPEGTSWKNIPGRLKQIDSGPPGIVYGVNAQNHIFCRTGITQAQPEGGGWRNVPGRLKYVSCGPYGCWGTNHVDDIFFRHGVQRGNCGGTRWTHIRGKLRMLEASADGTVYGVNAGNGIFVREGITSATPVGTHWRSIPAYPTKHVSAGSKATFSIGIRDDIFSYNENPVWGLILGRLKQADVSRSDVVWGVNSNDDIFLREQNGDWRHVTGKLKHVSFGDSGVWGVNSGDYIFNRVGVTSNNPIGTTWKQIQGRLKQIDSGPPGIVYGVNAQNYIFCRTGITPAQPEGGGWRNVPGRLKYVSCGPYGCWGTNHVDDIFFRHGVQRGNCGGTRWTHIRGKLKQLEVKSDGSVFGVNSANYLFIREGVSLGNPTGTHWRIVRSPRFKLVSAGTNVMYAVTPADDVFNYNEVNPLWSFEQGKLKQLDISPADVIWTVTPGDLIQLRIGDQGRTISGRLKHVSVGNAGVWGVNAGDYIFFREGVASNNPGGRSWTRVNGRLKQIDSGPAGIVYGVNSANQIYCRTGITSDTPKGTGWRRIAGSLKYVSCGPFGCWGTNRLDDIWHQDVAASKCELGINWKRIPGKLRQLEVNADGQVYGVNAQHRLFFRQGVTPNKPEGTGWRYISSPNLRHISAGTKEIWGIDDTTSIVRFTGLEFPEERYAILLTDDYPKGGIGKIAVRNPVPGVVYSLTRASQVVQIDSQSGQLTLLLDVDGNEARVNNSRFQIKAALGGDIKIVSVIIYVLPLHYGDPLALPAMTAVRKGLEESHTITLNYGPAAEISPELLVLLFKNIPSGDAVHGISRAETLVERAINLVKTSIIHAFEKEYGRGAVLALLRIQELFSRAVITKLDRESSCHDITSEVSCEKKPVYRRSDGKCSNLKFPTAGAAGTPYIRLVPAKYYDADGLNDPIGFPNQPNAPEIPSPFKASKLFIKDEVASSAAPELTPAVMQFGQFLDHDLDLAAGGEGSTACSAIRCDGSDDDYIAPCYPILPLINNEPPCVRFVRSSAMCQVEGYPMKREQINDITGVIDGNNIYGSSEDATRSLRDLENDVGLMLVSKRNGREMLPLNPEDTVCIDGCFKAGDLRANEQQGLTSFHTLFLREHNRIARKLKQLNNHWDGEKVFQETRKIVGAVLQKIVYKDYLPIILGPNAFHEYKGHDENVDPGISNAFATAAYRFGHSTIRSKFDLLNVKFEPKVPPILLRFMFFNNTVVNTYGIEPVLLGLVGNISEKVDTRLSKEITEHLFERGNMHGENLAALNLQRSRDHGLPGYNSFRRFCKLPIAKNFDETRNEIQDPENREILKRLYNDNPDLVELWMAGLAEVPYPGATVGPTLRCVIRDQFRRSRDGDRFFYENEGIFTGSQVDEINKASLSRIYCDNVDGIMSIQRNAFKSTVDEVRPSCEQIPGMSLCQWKECDSGVPHFRDGKCTCQ